MSKPGERVVERSPATLEPALSKQPQAALQLALPTAFLGAGYLVAYVLLDWISFIEPYRPFGITPWNPNTGLSITVILLFGRRMIPFQFIAPVLGDLVVLRQIPLPLNIELASAVLIGGVYGSAALLLMHPKLRFHRALQSTRDLFPLAAVTVVSAAMVAAGYVGL